MQGHSGSLATKRVAAVAPGPAAALQRSGPSRCSAAGLARRRAGVIAAKKQNNSGGGGGGGNRAQRGFGEAGGARRGGGGSSSSASSGGGQGKGNGGKGSAKEPNASKGSNQQRTTVRAPVPSDVKVSSALQHKTLDLLSGWEPAPAPFWSTFCGHVEGEWLGQYAAYTPWGAEPEPVWADDSGRYLLHAYSRTAEVRRPDHPAGDVLARSIRRGAYLSELLAPPPSSRGGAPGQGGEEVEEEEEEEGFGYNVDGSVVFDGGSYSVGPLDIGELLSDAYEAFGGDEEEGEEEERLAEGGAADMLLEEGPLDDEGEGEEGSPGEGEDPLAGLPAATVVVEQALVQGGQERRRMVATLKLRQPLAVARLVLYVEHWCGAAPEEGRAGGALKAPPPSQNFAVAATDQPRATPGQLRGVWNSFGVTATPVREVDPSTGEMRDLFVYSGREERQEWAVPGQGVGSDDEGGDDGGSLWLPGGCVVTFRMLGQAVGGSGGSSANGNGNGANSTGSTSESTTLLAAPPPRGVAMSFVWALNDTTCLAVEREYDPEGRLLEVRCSSSVKGGWSGGRM